MKISVLRFRILKMRINKALKQEQGSNFDYRKLYLSLVESIKEYFDSPICLDKMKSPFILKSGVTIGEYEFTRLYSNKNKDPYDRTKKVDTEIPNLALRNIMDTVEKFEDIHSKMPKYEI